MVSMYGSYAGEDEMKGISLGGRMMIYRLPNADPEKDKYIGHMGIAAIPYQ